MPFPISDPRTLTRRLEALMESEIRAVRPDVAPAAIARAVRSPRGMLAIIIRTFVLGLYEVHLHLRWWGQQYFPDTAELEFLLRHAAIWGVVRRPATKAIGKAEVEGAPGTIIPAGRLLQGAGVTYEILSAETIGDNGGAALDVRATVAGPIGNAAAETPLSFVEDIPGLTAQVATVDASGLNGGADIEVPSALLGRLLAEIQEPAHGGAKFDYPRWVTNAFAASQVEAYGDWVGRGSVGVVVAMGTRYAPRVPTEAELDAIAAEIEIQRPVTAERVIVPVVLKPIALSIELDPLSAPVKAAVEAAIRTFFAVESKIGGKLYLSRLSEAISSAAGEYRHRLILPAATVTTERYELAVPGVISWSAPA